MRYADLIGIPFKLGGRGPDCFDCFDCYGLVRFLIERHTGRVIPDYETPEDAGRVQALMAVERLFWHPLPAAVPGSVVLFRLGREACHVGYVLSHGLFIHAWEKSSGVTVERLALWERRIEGFYEYTEAA